MNKQQRKTYMKNWRQINRKETTEYKKKYNSEHPLKVKSYKRKYRLSYRRNWRLGAIKFSSIKAEQLIRNKVLPNLRYSDIIKPSERFCFDALCKKNNQIYAVEVTTSPERVFKKSKYQFMDYFKLPLLLFFVKPNLKEYWLITNRNKLSNRTFYYKQGRRFQIP